VNSTNGAVSVNLTAVPGTVGHSWIGAGDAERGRTLTRPSSWMAEVRASGVGTSYDFGLRLGANSTALALYPYGSTVRLTAVPTRQHDLFPGNGRAANGQFASPVKTSSSPLAIPLSRAVFFTLPANTHSLTVLITGTGNVAKAPQESNYLHNASVTLTRHTGVGSVFVNWTGDTNSALNPLDVVMNTKQDHHRHLQHQCRHAAQRHHHQPGRLGTVFTAPVNLPFTASASTAVWPWRAWLS